METLILNSKSKKDIQIMKQIALKFGMEILEAPYDPVFVAKVQKGVNASEAGKKGRKVDLNNLWKDCKLDHTPNAKTLKTFSDTDKGIGLTKSKNAADLFKKLGI